MSTNDPEFYQAPKFSPEPYPPAPPKQHGCFFYGCIIASIMALLLVILVAVGSYFLYRFATKVIDQYTSTAPRELPKVDMTKEERKAVRDRFDAFRKVVEEGTSAESLVLTSDDLNSLIQENEDLRGLIYVKVDGDEVKGQVSIPLDKIGFPMVRGRYLNGEADLKASLKDGVLMVTLDGLEVNGQKVPDNVMEKMRQQNLAKDFYKDEKNAQFIRKFESLEIKDGKIIIKIRARPAEETAKKEASGDRAAPPNGEVPSKKSEAPAAEAVPKA